MGCFPHMRAWGLTNALKKRHFKKLCKLLAIKAQVGLAPPPKNVLTAKKGLFWGVLEEKRGGRALKKPFYFAFFRFLGTSSICKPLSINNLHGFSAFHKNRAKKPTVGFSPFGGCGIFTPCLMKIQ